MANVNAEMRKVYGEAFKQKLQEYAGLKVKAEDELIKQKIREAKGKEEQKLIAETRPTNQWT